MGPDGVAARQTDRVNARSALFDVYGDHLLSRGGRAPVAALVRLLAPLGVAAPAVRTAVSRMVRQGWLEPVRLADGPGYALTPRAVHRLDEAARRIYRTSEEPWDGHWHLLVVPGPQERSRRDRLRSGLAYLGYAPLGDATWIAPRSSPELDALLEAEEVRADRFRALAEDDPGRLLRRAWDLVGLAAAYERWLEDAQALVEAAGAAPGDRPLGDEEAFAVRSRLVHEWRKFLFRDPGLPRACLPEDWAGDQARDYFDTEARRLLPAAARFVDAALGRGAP